MSADLYWYRAALVRVVDGDTLILSVDLGMRIASECSVRVAGINTPEIFSGTDRRRGQLAKEATASWLMDRSPVRWPLLIHTQKDGQSFARYVAEVYDAATMASLADHLEVQGW